MFKTYIRLSSEGRQKEADEELRRAIRENTEKILKKLHLDDRIKLA